MVPRPYNQDIDYNEEEARRKLGAAAKAPPSLDEAIKRCQELMFSQQYAEGYWWAELESNVTIAADTVLLFKIFGIDGEYPMHKIKNYLLRNQRSSGGWELFYGDGGEISVSIEAYIALKLLGIPETDPVMKKALKFIHAKGGVTKSRIFTKLCLAMIGCFSWEGIPSMPAWVALLPSWFFSSIYEMSSWARGCTVPLIIVFDKKPVFKISPAVTFDELYAEGRRNAKVRPSMKGSWTDIFVVADYALKFAESWGLVPFRERGLQAAEKWVVERQEDTGDWAGIFPAMFYSLLCLRALGYDHTDPVVHRGFLALKDFSIETESEYWVQPCVSPVWDTALVVRSLAESGVPRDHPALQRAGEWLLSKQILQHGDWWHKNRTNQTGGWAFEFVNRWYPDVDDSAVVVMALNEIVLPREDVKQGAVSRSVKWIESMQCKAGGWGAFDKDNDQDWLNQMPFGDLKAMIDPNTADVTARVLEMAGRMTARHAAPSSHSLARAVAYLKGQQEKEGCWYGRWGVNFIYGTCGTMVALALVAGEDCAEELARGAAWLVEVQNKDGDGGWGEEIWTYNAVDPEAPAIPEGRHVVKGGGPSTPSQSAWAIMGLLAAGDVLGKYEVEAIEMGVDYLLRTQRLDGSWCESWFTGTGFPCHFYLRYHYYSLHFTLTALGRYRARLHRFHHNAKLGA